MRHLPMKLGAAVCCQPLCLFQPGRRHAWLSQNDSPNLTEKARHYGHHYDGYYGVRITGIGEATGTTGRMGYQGWNYHTTAGAITALLASGAVTVRIGGLHSADPDWRVAFSLWLSGRPAINSFERELYEPPRLLLRMHPLI